MFPRILIICSVILLATLIVMPLISSAQNLSVSRQSMKEAQFQYEKVSLNYSHAEARLKSAKRKMERLWQSIDPIEMEITNGESAERRIRNEIQSQSTSVRIISSGEFRALSVGDEQGWYDVNFKISGMELDIRKSLNSVLQQSWLGIERFSISPNSANQGQLDLEMTLRVYAQNTGQE